APGGEALPVRGPAGVVESRPAPNHAVCLRELGTGKLVKGVVLPGRMAGPVAISPDGKRFAAAGAQPGDPIRLWDIASGEELSSLGGFRDTATALAFSPDGKRLVSGMKDTYALVWDLTALPRKKPADPARPKGL